METERRSTKFGKIRHNMARLRHEAYLFARQWWQLASCFGSCLVMTVKLLLRMVRWTVRFLTPIPQPMGRQSQYRKQQTGLAIPTFDLIVVMFGVAVLVSHLW